MIYIREAHASDRWKLGNHVVIKEHQTIEDRGKAAQVLINRFHCEIPTLLDSMSNMFNYRYAVWPERYFIIGGPGDPILKHVSMPTTEYGFDRDVLYEAIKSAVREAPDPILVDVEKPTGLPS